MGLYCKHRQDFRLLQCDINSKQLILMNKWLQTHGGECLLCFPGSLSLCPEAFPSSDCAHSCVGLAPACSSIVEVKLVVPHGHTSPLPLLSCSLALCSAGTCWPVLGRARMTALVQLFFPDRLTNTPLCWQTLSGLAPVKPGLRPGRLLYP